MWYVMRVLCPLQTRSLALQSPWTGIEFQSLLLCFPYLPSFIGLTQPRYVIKKGSNGYCPLYLLNCKFHFSRSCSPSLALSTEPGTWNICGLTEEMSLKDNRLETRLIFLPCLRPSFSVTNRVTLHPESWDPFYLETVANWRYLGEDPSHLSARK